MPGPDLRILLSNLRDEQQAVHLYHELEAVERGAVAQLFARLRAEAGKQALLWEKEIVKNGPPAPPYRPGARVRLVGWLVRRLGPRRLLPVLSAMKVRGLAIYRGGAAATPVARAAGEESWHRATGGGGALRAAVFGVNDGLVSNASLILGVTGAALEPGAIVLTGIAGMLAGGFSMATGEYISVRTQREFLEHQIAIERSEIAVMPEEEITELAIIYQAKGMDPAQAEALARRIVSDPEQGLLTLAREELGLDPQSLASPAQAATASFVSFTLGALIPLIPFLVTRGPIALAGTLAVTLLALFAVGGVMSLFTGRRPVWSAVRMALLGSAAGAATWLVGRAV